MSGAVTWDALEVAFCGNYLFRGLTEKALERARAVARTRRYSAGSTIFSQGDVDGGLYCVLSGKVRISASAAGGREVFFNVLEEGDAFGEIAVIDGNERTASATAVDDCTLTVFTRESFLELVRMEPQLGLNLLKLLCKRVRWTSQLAEESVLLAAPARLAKRLLVLSALHGTPVADAMELRISQSELAAFLGISRQFVNRHLQDWRQRGWIEIGRSRISVLDGEALKRLVETTECDAASDGALKG